MRDIGHCSAAGLEDRHRLVVFPVMQHELDETGIMTTWLFGKKVTADHFSPAGIIVRMPCFGSANIRSRGRSIDKPDPNGIMD